MVKHPNNNHKKRSKGEYDVVIIGAGLGGLVCGCYLAKKDIKVLILERGFKVGGCCVSFKREGYTFDAGIHYIGSCREGGIVYSVLKELSLLGRLNLLRSDFCDQIITPNEEVFFRKDIKATIEEFVKHFPKEKENIERFFNFLYAGNFASFISRLNGLTFSEFLDDFFANDKLKSILSIPVGNLGLSPSKASALASAILYKEYLLDGGYYPEGGIQVLPDLLAARFKELGGEILLSTEVTTIKTKDGKAIGVELDNRSYISANFVVSNADATATFKEMIDCDCREKEKVDSLKISPSTFVVYLGINRDLGHIFKKHPVTWLFSTYDIDKCYAVDEHYNLDKAFRKEDIFNIEYLMCHFPSLVDASLAPKDKSVIRMMIWTRYANDRLWGEYKEDLCNKMITKLKSIIPDVEEMIETREIATPATFYRYTHNYRGAAFGWAATVDQMSTQKFPSRTSIKNLYLVGHWVTNGIGQSGVPLVAYCGRHVADMISRNILK